MRPYLCIAVMALFAGALAAETRIVSSTSGGKTRTYSTEVREIAEAASKDGTILKYMGNQGPGTPYMETELVEVKP
jgi:hypothetical protein